MSKKRILVWTGDDFETGLSESVANLGDVSVTRAKNKSDALENMPKSDAFITSNALWDDDCSAVLASSQKPVWIQLINAGFDNLIKAGIPDHVVVSANGGVGANIVAEHTISMLLALLRRLPEIIHSQEDHLWNFESLVPGLQTLHGRKIAVIGYGNIGSAIVDLLANFGVSVTVITRSGKGVEKPGVDIRPSVELLPVLGATDVLILAVPLTDDTEMMIDASAFAAMRQDHYLVNVSRGRVVDTQALIKTLREGRLAGVALDVTDPEPLPVDHPLWGFPNVIISPHIAWAGGGDAVRKRLETVITGNVRRFLNGEDVEHIVSINPVGERY